MDTGGGEVGGGVAVGAEEVLRQLIDLVEMARTLENFRKLKRGDELLKRVVQLKEMLMLRVHDCVRSEKDPHVAQSLSSISMDCAATVELLEKVEEHSFFTNRKYGKKVEAKIRDIITDGMNLATAMAMAALAASHKSAVEAAVEKCKGLVTKAVEAAVTSGSTASSSTPEDKTGKTVTLVAGEEGEDLMLQLTNPSAPPTLSAFTPAKVVDDGAPRYSNVDLHELLEDQGSDLSTSRGKATEDKEPEEEDEAEQTAEEAAEEDDSMLICEEGNRWLLEGDMEKAFQSYMVAAEKGFPPAQHQVGVMLENEVLEDGNSEGSVAWFTKAAEQGHADSLFSLGCIFRDGRCGVEKNFKTAGVYFRESAVRNHVESMFQYALLIERKLLDDDDAIFDPGEALRWYQSAASSGHAKAQCNAGAMLYSGRGCAEPSPAEAFEMFVESSKQGHPAAMHNLGVMYEAGDYVEQSEQKAATLYTASAKLGHLPALLALINLLEDDPHSAPLLTASISEFLSNCSTDIKKKSEALFALGEAFRTISPPRVSQALEYLLKAESAGHTGAGVKLAAMYFSGIPGLLPKNPQEAVRLYEKHARSGNSEALLELGIMYLDGIPPVPQSTREALRLLKQAAEKGNQEAIDILAELEDSPR